MAKEINTQTIIFNPAAKTLNFSAWTSFDIRKLVSVINDDKNTEIYAIGDDEGRGLASFSGTTLTLQFDTTSHSAGDRLTAIYDDKQIVSVDSLPAGLATSALQTSGNASLSSIDGKLPALSAGKVPVDTALNPLTDTQLRASPIAVSGTFFQATQPVSFGSLPAGSNTIGAISNTAFIANAGTNLNTSALALESGGNLSSINTKLPAQGGAVISNSIPVNIASDQLDLSIVGQAAQTATVNNILTITAGAAAIDVSGFRSASVQVVSTGTAGTYIFEGSNNNVNFQTIPVFNQIILTGTPISAAITATASSLIYQFPINFAFLRLRIATTITGGSVQAFTRLSQQTWTPAIFQVAQATAGNLQTTATISSGTITTSQLQNGQTAHSSASTGSPVRVAGRVNTTADTTLVAGDVSDLFMSTAGQLIIKPYATSELDWQYTATLTTNTATAMTAAGAASIRNYLTGLVYQNTSATATTVLILDGATTIATFQANASMAMPAVITFRTPLRGTAATALNINCGTTGANVIVNSQGFKSF